MTANGGVRLFVGSKVTSTVVSANSIPVWTKSQFKSAFGREFNNARDAALFMNGDATANDAHIDGSAYTGDGTVYATLGNNVTASKAIRINYVVLLRG